MGASTRRGRPFVARGIFPAINDGNSLRLGFNYRTYPIRGIE